MISEIIVKCPGKPARRIMVVRLDSARRWRLARRLWALGFSLAAIHAVTRLPHGKLRQGIEEPRGSAGSIWGQHIHVLHREMARVAP